MALTAGWTVVVAALAGAVITAFYLVRRTPPRVFVSFDGLWADLAGIKTVQGRRVRIRHLGSWMLQLLIMGLILLALPLGRLEGQDPVGRDIVVLVDRSASMAVGDPGHTRLDRAREAVEKILTGVGDGDRVMLMSFAATPVAETGFEVETDRIRKAATLLTVLPEGDDAEGALALAERSLRGKRRPLLVLVSDQTPTLPVQSQPPSIDRRMENVGGSAENLAVESLRIGRSARRPSHASISFRVKNHGVRDMAVRVQLWVDDRVVATHQDVLPKGGTLSRTDEQPIEGARRVEARIISLEGDSLSADNALIVSLPPLRKLPVWVAGPSNLYLQSALSALGPTVEIHRSAVGDGARWPQEAVVIFDGVTPTPIPIKGRFLYLGPEGPGHPFPGGAPLRAPVVTDHDPSHPLMASVSLRDLNIETARALQLGPEDRVLASSFGTPLIAIRERPGLRVAAIAFDPRRSDLPLRPALPLLIANALDWLGDRPDASIVEAITAIPPSESALGKPIPVVGWKPLPTTNEKSGRDMTPVPLLGLMALLLGEWISRGRRWTS